MKNNLFPLYFEKNASSFQRGLSVNETKKYPKLKKHFINPKNIPARHERYKMTIVWDLDQTLVSADGIDDEDENDENTKLVIRPRAKEILSILRRNGDVEFIVWTAGTESHAKRVIHSFGESLFDIVISRNKSWFPNKNLNLILGNTRSLKSIVLVDDRMDIGVNHPENVLIVPPYYPKKKYGIDDATLLYLANILQRAINEYIVYEKTDLPFYSHMFSPLTEKCVFEKNHYYYGVKCFLSRKELDDEIKKAY